MYDRARGEFRSPEAYQLMFNFWPQGLYQATWNSPTTNKLLLEAGVSYMNGRWPYPSPGDGVYQVKPTDISILELSTNFPYNAKDTYSYQTDQFRQAQRASVSYVTGSHAFKVGVQQEEGIIDLVREGQGPDGVTYQFLRGAIELSEILKAFIKRDHRITITPVFKNQTRNIV